jgi:hypothetical protein
MFAAAAAAVTVRFSHINNGTCGACGCGRLWLRTPRLWLRHGGGSFVLVNFSTVSNGQITRRNMGPRGPVLDRSSPGVNGDSEFPIASVEGGSDAVLGV